MSRKTKISDRTELYHDQKVRLGMCFNRAHEEMIHREKCKELVGDELSKYLKTRTFELYKTIEDISNTILNYENAKRRKQLADKNDSIKREYAGVKL